MILSTKRVFALISALMLGLVAWMSGCRSVDRASLLEHSVSANTFQADEPSPTTPTTPTTIDSENPDVSLSRWPARWGNHPDQPGTIVDLDPADPLRPIHLSRFHQFRSTDIEYADANQLAAAMGITTGFRFKPEGPGSFLFIPNPKNESTPDLTKDTGKQSRADIPDLAFKFVSATPVDDLGGGFEFDVEDPETKRKGVAKIAVKESSGLPAAKFAFDEDHVELQRTWFTYRDPKKKFESDQPVGTIILLPGMFGTPDVIVDALENYWHHQGYAILRMRSHPSRFTAGLTFSIKPEQAQYMIDLVAQANDDRVAEGAYATKAAIDHLFEQRPGLKDKPTILVGMSGGAMMLPTVYAYAPQRYQGAVLIAGGANFLQIALDSNYKEWIDAITFDFKPGAAGNGEIVGQLRENFLNGYLKESRLDAYTTATEMKGIPVLMLHGTNDKAVPSETGELLYDRLGKPERWSYPVGHELIFMGLPTQVARIDKWITKHVIEPSKD